MVGTRGQGKQWKIELCQEEKKSGLIKKYLPLPGLRGFCNVNSSRFLNWPVCLSLLSIKVGGLSFLITFIMVQQYLFTWCACRMN